MTRRAVLLIGRHGRAPQKPSGGSEDRLYDEVGAVPEIYQGVGVPFQATVAELGLELDRAFLRHTNKERTRRTGEAVLAGAFQLEHAEGLTEPTLQAHLAGYDFRSVDTSRDERMQIGPHGTNINMDVYKDPARGPKVCLDYWLENPDATQHLGKPIETFRSLYTRTAQAMVDHAQTAVSGAKDLGVVVSHCTVVEAAIVALVNSGAKTPVARMDDIGGTFGMAEFAELRLEGTPGGLYRATLEVKGQQYKVDLNEIGKR